MSETVNPNDYESTNGIRVLRVHPSGEPSLTEEQWSSSGKLLVSLKAYDTYGEPVFSTIGDIIKGEFWGWRYNVSQRISGLPIEILADREGSEPGEDFARAMIPSVGEPKKLDSIRFIEYEYAEKDRPRRKVTYREKPDSLDREKTGETTYYFDTEGRIRASIKFGYYEGTGELSNANLYEYEQVGDDLVNVIGVRYASRISLNDAFPRYATLKQVDTRSNIVIARATYDDIGVSQALVAGIPFVRVNKDFFNPVVSGSFAIWESLPHFIELPTLVTKDGISRFLQGASLREIGK